MKMRSETSILAATALAAIAFAVSGSAIAQKSDTREVIIEAKHAAKRPEPTSIATPKKTVSLAKRVSYADLDLTAPSGAEELKRRINHAATTACKELLDQFHVVDASDRDSCAKDAFEGAMVQASAAIQAAEQGKSVRTAKSPAK